MKNTAIILALIIFIMQEGCSAMLLREQIAVGGLYPDRTTADEVVQLHGEFTSMHGDMRYYAATPTAVPPSVSIRLSGNYVVNVTTTLRDWETPDGVHRGMNEMVLNDVYGPADEIVKEAGIVRYCYYNRDYALEFWVKPKTGEIYLIVAKCRY